MIPEREGSISVKQRSRLKINPVYESTESKPMGEVSASRT